MTSGFTVATEHVTTSTKCVHGLKLPEAPDPRCRSPYTVLSQKLPMHCTEVKRSLVIFDPPQHHLSDVYSARAKAHHTVHAIPEGQQQVYTGAQERVF